MVESTRKSPIASLAVLIFALLFATTCAIATPHAAYADEPLGAALPLVAQESGTYSGTSGTCAWEIDAEGSLTIRPTSGTSGQLGSWETDSAVPWNDYRGSITSVGIVNTVKAPSCCYMFQNCASLTSVDLTGLDTASVTGPVHMTNMFSGCSSLTTLNLGTLDTTKADDMSGMFSGCSSLASLNLSGLNTANATSMAKMFSGCSSLTSLDLRSFNTENAKSLSAMFQGCSKLQIIEGVSGFKTLSATAMTNMFENCATLTTLDLSGYDVSNVTSTSSMFSGCSALQTLTLWNDKPESARNEDMHAMFAGCSSLTELNLASLNTGATKYMESMFESCSALTVLDVSGFDTSKAANMKAMFKGCAALVSLDVSGFQTPTTTPTDGSFLTVTEMFSGCSSLKSLKLFSLDTSIRGGALNSHYKMTSMFEGCSSLETLDLTPFNTSKVTHMDSMLKNCSSLRVVDISSFNPSKILYTDSMFEGCSALTDILAGDEWGNKTIYSSTNMFLGCTQIVGDVGTVYDPNHVTADYAHIDAEGNPGYFTDAINLKAAVVTISPTRLTYNRDYQRPESVVVTLRGVTLREHTDYELRYSNYKDAGTATITVTGINDRYRGSKQVTYTIDPLPVTVKLNDGCKVFGGDDPVLTAEVTGAFQYEPVNYTLTREPGENVGGYAINAILGSNPNYAVTVEGATFTIEKKTATVAANNASKSYGSPDPALTATVEGEVAACPVRYTLAREKGESWGAYPISVTLGDNPNYDITSSTGATFTITKAPGTAIGLSVNGYEGVYDGATHSASATGQAEGTTIQYSIDGGTTWGDEAPSIKDAGEKPFLVKAQNPNYDDAVAKGLLRVKRRSVIVKADDKSKVFGESDPEPTATVEGTLGSDTVAYTLTARAVGENVGKYAIAVEGDAEQGNYEVAFQPGTLAITPASIEGIRLSLSQTSFAYNGKIQMPDIVSVGEKALKQGTDFTLAISDGDGITPGTHSVKAIGKGNYTGGSQTAEYRIEKASIEGAALALSQTSFTYNGLAQKPLVEAVGGRALSAGEDYTLVFSSDNPTEAGSYTVRAEGKGFYEGTSAEATFTIARRPVTVSAQPATKVFGTADPTLNATVRGTLGKDSIAYSLSRAAGESVGTYAIAASGSIAQGNYSVSYVPSTLTISPASIEGAAMKLTGANFTYSGSAQKPAVLTIGGMKLVAGRDYTLSYKNNVNAGNASAIVSGRGNYAGTASAAFKIAKSSNSLKLSKKTVKKTLKAKALKKKAKTITLPKTRTKFGKVTWKVAKKDKKRVLTLKAGKIKVKKGAKKGIYTIKLQAKVKASKNYKASATKTVSVKVIVT